MRRADAAWSVGTYLALATLNRVVAPCSKLGFADWWDTTAGPRFTKVPVAATDHRRFWGAMNHLDTDKLAQIERKISTAMVTEWGQTVETTWKDSARRPCAQPAWAAI